MDKQTENLFAKNSDYVLGKASELYDFRPEQLNRLGSFESFVFEFERGGQAYILRVTPGSHRSPDQIRGELDWINYLSSGGVPAASCIPSNTGSFVEVITPGNHDGGKEEFYNIAVFEKAAGRIATKEDWNEKLFTQWGRVLGRMHALTKDYEPPDPSYTRHTWYDDEDLSVERHIPASQTLVLEKYETLMKRLQDLPTDRDSFGLVHEDLHHSNFFVDDGNITVFDFDDCQYHWFAADISIPLFYVMRNKRLNEPTLAFAELFMNCLLEGYSQENSLDKKWLNEIPLFLKLREMILYIIIYAEQAFEVNDWCREFYEGRRQCIEQGIPVIDMDFSQFG